MSLISNSSFEPSNTGDSDTSDSDNIIAQIHLWIFEYSYKHQMKHVTKRVLSRAHILPSIKKSIENWRVESRDEVPPVKDDILFLFLVDNLKSLLNNIQLNENENSSIKIDFDLLNLVTEMIENIYRRTDIIAFNTFATFLARLKLLELICRIALKEPTTIIMDRLKILFPHWDENYEKDISKKIKIPDKEALKKLGDAHKKARNNILQILISENKRKEYLSTSFKIDLKDIVQNVTKHLSSFSSYAEGKITPTAIEQIIHGIYENTTLDKEPAIRILLDHLSPQMTAKDLLIILDKLSPETKVIRMDSCFSEFSDSESDDPKMLSSVSERNEIPELNTSQPLFHFEDVESDLFLARDKSPKPPKLTVMKYATNSARRQTFGIKSQVIGSNKTEISPTSQLLPVKRRLYSSANENSTESASLPRASNSINEIRQKSEGSSKKIETAKSKKRRPAPKSVKKKRKKYHLRNPEKPSSSAKAQVVNGDIPQSSKWVCPESPYKRKSLVISLKLKGMLLNPDGRYSKFYA